MRTLALLALFAFPVSVLAADKPDLTIEITAPKSVYPDEQVKVSAVIRNNGKTDAYIVRAIDGSFDNLRSVVAYKWIVKKGGQPQFRRTDVVRIDNMVNALAADDVLLVKAGKTVDPQVGGFGNFPSYHDLSVPGKYTIALRFELNPAGREKGVEKALDPIRDQGAVLIDSEAIEVTVLPWPPAIAAAEDKLKAASARLQIVRQFAETVAKNPNATAEERDAASERLKRAQAVFDEAKIEQAVKVAEFKKQRDEERKKK